MFNQTVELADIEMALIRILSVNGLILSGENMSNADRRERIRVTIMERKCQQGMFNEDLTYAQAYKRCYNRPVELRKTPRPDPPGPDSPGAGSPVAGSPGAKPPPPTGEADSRSGRNR